MDLVSPKKPILNSYLKLAKKLAGKDRILPSVADLKRNGYTKFYLYFRNHRSYFYQFKQRSDLGKRKKKVLEERIKLAKKLTKENNGLLPTTTELKEKHPSFLGYYVTHKDVFKDIPKARSQKTRAQHIQNAENLAKNNKGVFPGSTVVIEKHGWALYRYILRNPELFVHIPGIPKTSVETAKNETKK